MTLATHAVVGAAAASLFPSRPITAFTVAFASHFMIDAIPHWHYPLKSVQNYKENPMENDIIINRQFFFDLTKIALDGIIGLLLSYFIFHLIFHFSVELVLIGIIGGALPDLLQFVYCKWRHQPIKTLQRFHILAHTKKNLEGRDLIGIFSQIILMVFAVIFIRII